MAVVARTAGSWRAAGIGLLLLLLTPVFAVFGPEGVRWQLAIATGFVGLFLAVVLGPRTMPLADATVSRGLYQALDGLFRGLELNGPGVYVPARAQSGLSQDRVFVSAQRDGPTQLPVLDAETTLYGDRGGVAIVPPGMTILDAYEQRIGIATASINLAELGAVMGALTLEERLVKAVSYRRDGDHVTIRYRPAGTARTCSPVHEMMRRTGEQLGCPTCSALVLALARATGTPVVIDRIHHTHGETVLEVRLLS